MHDDLREFFTEFRDTLDLRGMALRGITTDGSPLYPGPIATIFSGVRQADAAEIAQLRRALLELEERSAGVSDAAREPLKAVWSRLTALEKLVKRAEQERTRRAAITQAVGDPARYRAELARYIKEFPDTDRATDFRRAIEEAPLWQGLEKWNEVVRLWQQTQDRHPDGEATSQILARINSLLQERADSPVAEAFRARIPYLEAIGRRFEVGQPIQAKLRELFADPLVAKVWMVIDTSGRRYYLLDQPAGPAERITSLRYVANFDFQERTAPVKRGDITYSGPAPQVRVATAVNATLAKMNPENWDASISSIVQAIYNDRSEPALDPLLKATLLRKTLELGCQASVSLQQAYGPYLEALNRPSVDLSANWVDPRDASAPQARQLVEAAIGGLPDMAAAARRAAEHSARLRACPAPFYHWIGWLHRSDQGEWGCSTVPGPKDSGRLCIICPATPDGGVSVQMIGTMEQGAASLSESPPDILIEGRPVYLEMPEQGAKSGTAP